MRQAMIQHGLHCRESDLYTIKRVLDGKAFEYKGLDLGPGDVLLDLGAHIGTSVKYALDRGVDHVIAVEMLPDTISLLRRNFGQHPQVTIVPAAVAGENAPDVLATRLFRNPMGASVSTWNSKARTSSLVPTVPITGLLHGYRPNKVKFDIENSEYDVITPYAQVLWNAGIERIAGEMHTASAATCEMARELSEALQTVGYQTNKPVSGYPTEKFTWNYHAAWWRPDVLGDCHFVEGDQ